MQMQESCILFYVHGVTISSRAAVTEVFAFKVSPVMVLNSMLSNLKSISVNMTCAAARVACLQRFISTIGVNHLINNLFSLL